MPRLGGNQCYKFYGHGMLHTFEGLEAHVTLKGGGSHSSEFVPRSDLAWHKDERCCI